jgi:23S rRNA-/tRNA-specific pseudouridylate synthase
MGPVPLWADAEFAVFNKPHSMPVYHAQGGFLDGLGPRHSVHACHRLDATTAGALMVAYSSHAADLCSRMFQERFVDKRYLAICRGNPAETHFSVAVSLLQRGSVAAPAADGKPATTHFAVLSTGRQASLLLATPITGRFHQVRAHLAHAGYPVMGDRKYGGGHALCVALHCARLAFLHPRSGAVVSVLAPLHAPFGRAADRVGILATALQDAMAHVASRPLEVA